MKWFPSIISCRQKEDSQTEIQSLSLYIGICRDDTRRPDVSTLFSYLHLIEFETLLIFI